MSLVETILERTRRLYLDNPDMELLEAEHQAFAEVIGSDSEDNILLKALLLELLDWMCGKTYEPTCPVEQSETTFHETVWVVCFGAVQYFADRDAEIDAEWKKRDK